MIRNKIDLRFDLLEGQLKVGTHLVSDECAATVSESINDIAKFFPVLSDNERDFINAARMAVEDQLEWK